MKANLAKILTLEDTTKAIAELYALYGNDL